MARTDENDELYDLFSAFDDVSASDELKAATLEKILGGEDTAEDADEHGNASRKPATKAIEEANASATRKANASASRAANGGTSRKAKWRVIRVAALAACLVLALTGGIAYATPVSHVSVTQDAVAIKLGVNCFGVVVEADSEDEEGRAVVESTELCNISRDESVERAVDSLEIMRPERPVEVDGEPRPPRTLRESQSSATDEPQADEPPADDVEGRASSGDAQGDAPSSSPEPQSPQSRPGQDNSDGSEAFSADSPSDRPDEGGGAPPDGSFGPDGSSGDSFPAQGGDAGGPGDMGPGSGPAERK